MNSAGKIHVALVQLCSGREIGPNMEMACEFIRLAAHEGAQYVQTPENTPLMELNTKRLFERIDFEEGNTVLDRFSCMAKDLRIWLHIGSVAVKISDERAVNRAYIFAPDGQLAARYDKIHMFDVALPDGECYQESKNYQPGDEAVALRMPWAILGLSTCYDLRFPEQYKALALAGAQILTVPSAFTRQTGEAHWHILLQARAIETGCFVFAAAQGGIHENGRSTYGHSLIISPWGKILAEAEDEPGIISAEIDLAEVDEARQRIPALLHACPINVSLVDAVDSLLA